MEWPVAAEQGTAEELAKTLREAIQRLSRRVRQARPVGDLTFSQLSALTSLQLAGALTPRELADVERVQPPTMTKIVGKLEERGLVARTPHPTDGRQVILAATDEGRAVAERLGADLRSHHVELLGALTAAERECTPSLR